MAKGHPCEILRDHHLLSSTYQMNGSSWGWRLEQKTGRAGVSTPSYLQIYYKGISQKRLGEQSSRSGLQPSLGPGSGPGLSAASVLLLAETV